MPLLTLLICPSSVSAHDHSPAHHAPTYEVTAPLPDNHHGKTFHLSIVDEQTRALIPARFSLTVDGNEYIPPAVGRTGLRFVSIHQGKNQRFTAAYSRGAGPVVVPLPDDARHITVRAAQGFEYVPSTVKVDVAGETTEATLPLRRWIDLEKQGWLAADEHLHYERRDPAHDADWLDMLAGDGLAHAHFLVLKGGNLPGVWAEQFAYGKDGEARDGRRLIRPGEEYRDGAQGHINLLGIGRVIGEISTGGIGQPSVPHHYPPLLDIFAAARASGGIGGPAHGASLSRSPTAVVDTVLGGVDFFEIANTHLYRTDVWYRLNNCGYVTPPAAGTDLPNFPFRDPWQPLLGEVRMYVRVGEQRDFESWKQAVTNGEVFVTSGPIVRLQVNNVGPGGIIRLPEGGGEITIDAELASPRELTNFEIVINGEPLNAAAGLASEQTFADDIHRRHLRGKLRIDQSGWLAARGLGQIKTALLAHANIEQRTFAHTAAIRVLVGDQPLHSPADARFLLDRLADQQQFYRQNGNFAQAAHRQRFLQLFDQAIGELEKQVE